MDDTWGKEIENKPAMKGASPNQLKSVKEAIYGNKPRELGSADDNFFNVFKFQVVGTVEWIPWAGRDDPDCVFSQSIESDDPMRGKQPKRPDVGEGDINKDAGNGNGVRRTIGGIGGGQYAYEDPVSSSRKGGQAGLYKRYYNISFSAGNVNCPCKPKSIDVFAVLIVDTSRNPAAVKWWWGVM